jgi:hypothetical protein
MGGRPHLAAGREMLVSEDENGVVHRLGNGGAVK